MVKAEARGRAAARALIAGRGERATALERRIGRPARLTLLSGADAVSRRFVALKQAALADLPLDIHVAWLDETADTAQAIAQVEALNQRDDVDAIFLQFPLPAPIDAEDAANRVSLAKDVDCSSAEGEARFLSGSGPFVPVAPRAAQHLLHDALTDLMDKQIVLAGADDPFMRALGALLRRAGANVQRELRGAADALVVGEVLPPIEELRQIERLRVLLDAAYYLTPRDKGWLAELNGKVDLLLGQHGNVGPLTVAYLAEATLKAAELRATS